LTVVEPVLSTKEPDLAAFRIAADAYSGWVTLRFGKPPIPGQDRVEQGERWAQAQSWYLKSLDTWHRIKNPSRDGPNGFDAGDPAQVAKT
jgi:hypothetical protein